MDVLLKKLVDLETGLYARWNVVPNLSSEAVYSFTTQTIELSTISSDVYRQAVEGKLGATRKVAVLLAHEVKHWIDHVGSVWGQNLLCRGYNAIHARIANNPHDLWRIIDFQKALRDTRFNRYYTTIESTEPQDGIKMWKYQMTTGGRFDHLGKLSEEHPIIFTRFAWLDNTPACRVPLSVVSLLESSATYFEYEVEHAFIGSLPSDGRRSAEEALQQKFLDLAYDPGWAEYSVAAHAIGNFVRSNNVPEAYGLASALSGIALNLVPAHFKRLRVPSSFARWGERNQALIANADRGYAFLVLANHAPHVPVTNIREWIAQTLDAAGLPPLDQIAKDAKVEMDALRRDLLPGPFDQFRDAQLEAGRVLFDELGPVYHFEGVFDRLTHFDMPLPPIILGEDMTVV